MTGGRPGLSGIMWNRNKERRALKNSCSVYPWWDLARSQWKTRQWCVDKIYWLYFYCLWAPCLLALIRDLLQAHITSFLLAWLPPGFFYTFNFMHSLNKKNSEVFWSKTNWRCLTGCGCQPVEWEQLAWQVFSVWDVVWKSSGDSQVPPVSQNHQPLLQAY